MRKELTYIVCFLSIFCIFGCSKKSKTNKDLTEAAENFLGNINKAPIVIVENGQSAVVKIREGYLFIIPNKKDFNKGSYLVLFSESGDFHKDSMEVLRKSFDAFLPPPIEVMDHMIRIVGNSSTWIKLQLHAFDESQIAISKFDGTDPNTLKIDELVFMKNTVITDEASEKFFLELGKELEKR